MESLNTSFVVEDDIVSSRLVGGEPFRSAELFVFLPSGLASASFTHPEEANDLAAGSTLERFGSPCVCESARMKSNLSNDRAVWIADVDTLSFLFCIIKAC